MQNGCWWARLMAHCLQAEVKAVRLGCRHAEEVITLVDNSPSQDSQLCSNAIWTEQLLLHYYELPSSTCLDAQKAYNQFI